MRCPYCGHAESVVKDSRPAEEDTAVRRRRGCLNCGGRFTTFERVQLRELIVTKRDGRRDLFAREKLTRSIKIAMQKRPVSEDQIEHIVSGIIRQLESIGENEVPSSTIGQLVMESLAGLDPVAYVRYASVYRDFKTPADFAKFIAEQEIDAPGAGEDE